MVEIFQKTGMLNIKVNNKLFLLNRFVLVPIVWEPNDLLNIYLNVSRSLDSLVHLNKAFNGTFDRDLIDIRNMIKIKSEQNLAFVKNFVAAGLLKNESDHSVVIGDRTKRQLGLASLIGNLIVSGVEEIQISKLQLHMYITSICLHNFEEPIVR